jgi:hypothetical protein
MYTARMTRASTVSVRCDKKQFGDFQRKRGHVVKDHMNKLLAIGNVDVKFVNDTLKEADDFHRKKFDELFGKKDHFKPVVDPREDDNVVSDDEGESLFKKP